MKDGEGVECGVCLYRAALLDYVERFGLSDAARDAFRAAGAGAACADRCAPAGGAARAASRSLLEPRPGLARAKRGLLVLVS